MHNLDMYFETNFLYPLYLLLIGGAITGGLIPWFNRWHESKLRSIEKEKERIQNELECKREEIQRNLEIQRQENQRSLDRLREDHKHSLKIKSELIERISKTTSETMLLVLDYQGNKNKKEHEKPELHIDWMVSSRTIGSLLHLYFRESEVNKLWSIIHDVLRDACLFVENPGHPSLSNTIEYTLKPHVKNNDSYFGWKNPAELNMLFFNDINMLIYDTLKIIQETDIDYYEKHSVDTIN